MSRLRIKLGKAAEKWYTVYSELSGFRKGNV